jgi:hypothetical protein
MKIRPMVITLCVLFVTVFPIAAQTVSKEKSSEYYYVSVRLEKIIPYRKGYICYYRKGLSGMAKTYLPVEWFTEAAGRGEAIRLGPGRTWPYLTVYYKDGAFSHVRLYVRPEPGHESWGNIPQGVNIDSYFENVDDIKLEF